MRNSAVRPLAIAALLSLAATANAQTQPSMPMMMPSVAPIFLEGSSFSSTLGVINDAKIPRIVQIDVYSLSGAKVASKSLGMEAYSTQHVSIGDLLAEAGIDLDIGSVRVASNDGVGTLAVLEITHHGQSDTYLNEEVAMPSMSGSTNLRGVSEQTAISPVVAVSSLSATPQHVTVTCLLQQGATKSQTFLLAANQTLVSQVCATGSSTSVLSAAAVAAQETANMPQPSAVGISIQTDGMPGELAAFGITPRVQQSGVFFSSLNFVDPKMRMSSGASYTGIPVGPSPLLPAGQYQPQLTLANFGSGSTSVTITAATTLFGVPDTRVLKTIPLASGAVQTLALSAIAPDPSLLNSVVVHYEGAPGDVLTKLTSGSASLLGTVDMLERDGANAENGGAHPWTIEEGITSVLFLFNHASAETNFNVRFGMANGPWMKVYKLAPMETRAININELIRVQEPDDQGHKLVVNSTSGEVGWQASSTQVAGRILQASPAMGMARNFSCQAYFYQCSISVTPNSSLNLTVGSSGNLGDITPVVDTIYGTLPSACVCNGSASNANLSLTYSWGTSALAILTAGEGLSFSTWKGTSAGSSTIPFSTDQTQYNIICNGQAPVTVTCTLPTAPDPGSVSRISYQITAVTSPPFPPLSTTYGETSAHPVSYDFTPYLSGNTWKARLTTASGSAQTWVRLLPGVQEASVASATSANYCKMDADLNALGFNSPYEWYMIEAVQAHENVHVQEYETTFSSIFSSVKSAIESLTTPFQCGDTIATAKARMQSAATNEFNSENTADGQTFNAIPDPNAQTNAAEHAVVDPVVAAINGKATNNGWPKCQ